MNKERLLNVAKALRESPNPEQFTMSRHVNVCGTPACAFGHYAARTDLQDEFYINTSLNPRRFQNKGVHTRDGRDVGYDSQCVADHFDLDDEEIEELFSGSGCDEAQTALEAAEYIERFVAEDA